MEWGTGRAQNQESAVDFRVALRSRGAQERYLKTVTVRAERANLMGRQVNVFPVEQEP